MDNSISEKERRLLQVIAGLAWQWMTNNDELVWHHFISANEEAAAVLEQYGLITPGTAETGGWLWTQQGKDLIPEYFR